MQFKSICYFITTAMAICYVLVHHYPSPLAGTALVKLPKQVIIQMKENYTRDVYGYIKLHT